MKPLHALLLATLLTLLLTSSATAALIVNKYSNDLTVTSDTPDTSLACACEHRSETITVQNTGNFYTTYTIDVVSEHSWYGVNLKTFDLAPGDSRDVLVTIDVPCGTIGSSVYSVRILTSYGRERVLTRTLDARKCQNVYLDVQGGVESSNLCQPIEYRLTVKNVAEFADTYRLDLGSFNDYSVIDGGSRNTYLVPNEQTTLDITIAPPCSLYGEITFPFTVTSEKNKQTERVTRRVSIENEFDHEIVTSTQIEVCSRVSSTLEFGVKNLIDVPNNYTLSISAPGFVSWDERTLSLKGGQQKNLTLTIDPKKGQEGVYDIALKVSSDLGNIKKTRHVELDVFNCYAYALGFVNLERAGDGAFTDSACCGEKHYTLNVRNNGQTEETYTIRVDGPDWFSPEEKTVRLKPSENRNVKFTADLPCTDETFEIPVTVSLDRHASISETVVYRVNSQTQRTCHAVALVSDGIKIDEEDSIIPVIIKHTGLEGGVYRVEAEGSLVGQPLETEITLAPGEEKVLHLPVIGNLTAASDGKYVTTLIVTHDALDLTYRQPFWTSFRHVSEFAKSVRSFFHYDYGTVSGCRWAQGILTVLLLVAIVAFVLFLLGRCRKFRNDWSETGLLALKAILILLLLVVVVTLALAPVPPKATSYEEPLVDSSGLVFQWYENERYVIDLGRYFEDPDADWLEFTATQPANIAVAITDGEAVLTPERNWAGEDKIVFTASDQKGGVVDSPILALKVLQREHLTFRQWTYKYCTHVNLTVLALLLLVLLLALFLTFTPRRDRPLFTSPDKVVVGKYAERKPEQRGRVVKTFVTRDGNVHTLGDEQRTLAAQNARVVKRASKKASKRRVPKRLAKASARSRSAAMDRALIAFNQKHELQAVLRRYGKRETKINLDVLQAAGKMFKQNALYAPHNRDSFDRYLVDKNILRRLEDKR